MAAPMEKSQLKKWLDSYVSAWEDHDAESAGQLFTSDAKYHQTPFTTYTGRKEIENYWERVTKKHTNIDVETTILGLDSGKGFARFYAEYRDKGGEVRLDGICVVKLHGDLCYEFREWWHRVIE